MKINFRVPFYCFLTRLPENWKLHETHISTGQCWFTEFPRGRQMVHEPRTERSGSLCRQSGWAVWIGTAEEGNRLDGVKTRRQSVYSEFCSGESVTGSNSWTDNGYAHSVIRQVLPPFLGWISSGLYPDEILELQIGKKKEPKNSFNPLPPHSFNRGGNGSPERKN